MPSMTLLANLQCHLPVVSQGSRSTKGSGKICNAKTCTEPWRPGGGSTSLPSIRRDDKRRRKKRGMKCQGQDRHRDAKIERPVTAVPAISRRRRAPSSCESSQSVSRSSEELITPHSMERRPRTAPQAKKLRQAKASSLIPYPPGGSNLIKAADVTPKAHGGWNGKRPGAKDCSKKKRRVKSKGNVARTIED
ncbi:hypothetical protein BC832DRAFT_162707 [Gaertneriomyces semiglobifer]|nr:hypothetical protein BC832DRAFT_162707 [Gaertneriomyces semiglobifer]